MRSAKWLVSIAVLMLIGGFLAGCGSQQSDTDEEYNPAEKSYVEPGELDDYYLFYSGGHGGNVRVAGVPSMRHIRSIPVFSKNASYGYGYDNETSEMLGDEYSWGDVHHPAMSKTDGKYDGRWLFVNDNAHNRVARIDLTDFETKQILGPLPNTSGNHGSSFVTPNTEYLLGGSRFAAPIPKGTVADPEDYESEYNGIITGIKINQESGEMNVDWQIKTPPFHWDLANAGEQISDGWAFFSSYNTEMAHEQLESGASQLDRDYAAFVNWEKAAELVDEGVFEEIDGVPVIDPGQPEAEGLMYYVPIPKSPHGIDVSPDGKWVIGSGKLEPKTTVINFEKFLDAIENEEFQDEERGVPVVDYDAVLEGQVPVGMGPLHTEFDDRGNAYTSIFIDSLVTKWALPPWEGEMADNPEARVIDQIDVHHNIGHLVTAHGDASDPRGDWLVAMNKHAAGRHLPTGPKIPETSQLIDISGEEMKMVKEAFTDKEPHFAQLVHKDVIETDKIQKKADNDHPHAVWEPAETSVERNGNEVTVEMMAVRSRFSPDVVEAKVGDEITFHITNIEQTHGMNHGFGIGEHDVNLEIDPGQTESVTLELNKPGVYPFYCTVFCSALHQEMQGYLVVEPRS